MRNTLLLLAVSVMLALAAIVSTPATAGATGEPLQTNAAVEWNSAVAGTPPHGLPCISGPGSFVCWEAYGDRFWVWDTEADGASAVARWNNYTTSSTSPYREGACRNSMGNNTWGYCNKNFTEGSQLLVWACRYNAGAGWVGTCQGDRYMRVLA
jgi:hypothetical protein